LLTVHLSIFISVFNQIDAQNLFHNKFYFMPLHVSSTCARNVERHEIKFIVKQILCIKWLNTVINIRYSYRIIYRLISLQMWRLQRGKFMVSNLEDAQYLFDLYDLLLSWCVAPSWSEIWVTKKCKWNVVVESCLTVTDRPTSVWEMILQLVLRKWDVKGIETV